MLAKLFFNLNFNGHAMAIPAGYIACVVTCKALGFNNHVFQNFVHGMTNVNIAIGVWRAIMQNECWLTSSCFTNLLVNLFLLPFFDPEWFTFGKVAPHRKGGV